jgi:hypothetical protein
MAVLPPATPEQSLGSLIMKTVSYLALVTAICVVIVWVFMALRPANAQQGYRPLSNKGRAVGAFPCP